MRILRLSATLGFILAIAALGFPSAPSVGTFLKAHEADLGIALAFLFFMSSIYAVITGPRRDAQRTARRPEAGLPQ